MVHANEQKLLARYLVQFLQLQAENASPKEFALWRKRVKMGFPDRRKRKTAKSPWKKSSRYFREDLDFVETYFTNEELNQINEIRTFF